MKPDPLEDHLRAIRWRTAPASLRERALTDPRADQPVAPWFFNRRIGIAFAAVWLAILFLRLDTPEPDRESPFPIALAHAWRGQLALVELWLDLPDHPLSTPTSTPKQ